MIGASLQKLGLAGLTQVNRNAGRLVGRRKGKRDGPAACDADKRSLDRVIEAEIIPRLMLAHSLEDANAAPSHSEFREDAVDRLARMAVSEDAATVCAHLTDLLARGLSRKDLLLHVMAPAARRLGEYWEEDLCDFNDVTIGLLKLHRTLRRLMEATRPDNQDGGDAPSVLLAPACGEQHSFGVLVVSDFFERSGWRTRCEPQLTSAEAETLAGSEPFDIVGLSVSAETRLDSLKDEISAVRAASCNRDVRLMVGGRVFAEDGGLPDRVGADGAAADGAAAVMEAERLLQMSKGAGHA